MSEELDIFEIARLLSQNPFVKDAPSSPELEALRKEVFSKRVERPCASVDESWLDEARFGTQE